MRFDRSFLSVYFLTDEFSFRFKRKDLAQYFGLFENLMTDVDSDAEEKVNIDPFFFFTICR